MKLKTLLDTCALLEKEALNEENHEKYIDAMYMTDALLNLEQEKESGNLSRKEFDNILDGYRIRIMHVICTHNK